LLSLAHGSDNIFVLTSPKMPGVAAALRREQVAYVRAIYQGQWDSGRVEDRLFYRADGSLLDRA
jgi:hypothetical protein